MFLTLLQARRSVLSVLLSRALVQMHRDVRQRPFLDGDEWVLNGSKCFITNGKVADVYIIIAITSITEDKRGRKKKNFSAFIVDKGTPGFSFGTKKKMGIRGSSTYELIFEDARIPKDALLGKEGRGFPIAMHTLDVDVSESLLRHLVLQRAH